MITDTRVDSLTRDERFAIRYCLSKTFAYHGPSSLAGEPAELVVEGVRLRQTLTGLIERMRWTPIDERMPAPCRRVLLTDGRNVTTAEFIEQDGWSIDYVSMDFGSPKAWMPLPEVP